MSEHAQMPNHEFTKTKLHKPTPRNSTNAPELLIY